VGNDPRQFKARCFEMYVFPKVSESHWRQIRNLAEQIDIHRDRQQTRPYVLNVNEAFQVSIIGRTHSPYIVCLERLVDAVDAAFPMSLA
jgi:hypothetical protein